MKKNTLIASKPKKTELKPLPLVSANISAGFGSIGDDHVEQNLDLHQFLIKHPTATFYIKVMGDSMKEAHIFKGDILIVDRAISAVDKNIVIAVVNGEFTVKRIRFIQKQIYLYPENKAFKPLKINPTWDFQVWGVVTYVIHKTSCFS